MKGISGLIVAVLVAAITLHTTAFAKSASKSSTQNGKQRYIVILDDPPLAAYDGRILSTPERFGESTRLSATANEYTGAGKLDVTTPESQQYLQFLDERFMSFRGEALLTLGREIKPFHRYKNAMNGFATELTSSEAEALRKMPRVRSVVIDKVQKLHTDSGPNWMGADKIYNGSAGVPATGGEGVVAGVFDSGINWDHPSFADPGEGGGAGWDHVNPYGSQLGLCSDAEVLCNDKLVGVYDFVEDDPNTPDVPEENTKGKDNSGHGSHVASIVVGNPTNLTFNGIPSVIGGVAPNANIITYRVCFIGELADPDDDGCQSSAILAAIDQAITDGVDVVNHSIGGSAFNPWILSSTSYAFLSLRDAGIFVATSNGNEGPNAGTTGSPANAPWVFAVGAATHDRVFASALENLSGGDTTPPGTLVGASENNGIGLTKIVHAKDFGNALCGTGLPELAEDCASSTGTTNPFAPGTFNGEIVVCDRGEYGRVEKGKNLLLAGAGGYVLANTESSFQSVDLADLCLPSTHIDKEDGDKLRAWLDSGDGHQGSISGFSILHIPEAGDIIASFSSRGPNLAPVVDLMKPDVIAPGVTIIGASDVGNNYVLLSGTSMSSPHVTGAAALIKSARPGWTPAMLASAITMTATAEQAIDFDDSVATVHKRGAGRPQLEQAVNAGLYLNITKTQFIGANPDVNGDPKELNLPGLIDSTCAKTCDFSRTVTDLTGGASWNVTIDGLADGVTVDVTPVAFALADGESRNMSFNVNITDDNLIGSWVYASVRLSSNSLPDSVFPMAIYVDGGLPLEWTINSDDVSGFQEFPLDSPYIIPDTTFTTGGLIVPTETTENLTQDPTDDDPYDGAAGVMTVIHDIPAGTMWFHTETLPSTSEDLDLFVGLDSNGDGKAQESEELCSSTSPTDIEFCDFITPEAGSYWVLVQNWTATNPTDEVTLKSAVVTKNTNSILTASGNGMTPGDELQNIRLSWDNVNAVPGTELLGAVGIGTRRDNPNNMGVITVRFNKTANATPETLVLMNGVERGLSIDGNAEHDRIFVDIPTGTSSFTITTSASGVNGAQNEALEMELYRVAFDDAFSSAPFASAPDTSGDPFDSATGTNSTGPSLIVGGGDAVPGRWYVVLKNSSEADASVSIKADFSFTGTPFPFRVGLWEASSRPGLSQGFDYSESGPYRSFLWYTYEKDGSPTWFVASGLAPVGNVWVAELLRVTNDGSLQQEAPVGHVSITMLEEDDLIFSFVVFGEEGSDRESPSLAHGCPIENGSKRSYNGAWARTAAGLGGATVVVNSTSQAYLHYIFDDLGRPIWLLGFPEPQSPVALESGLYQFDGDCPVCNDEAVGSEAVGLFTREFTTETSMNWTLDYVLQAPLSGSVDRTDETVKLTSTLSCP